MENFPIKEFRRDFIAEIFVQDRQFEQWLKVLFFLNDELSKNYDFIYQDAFYTKLYEPLTERLVYASKVSKAIEKGSNENKRTWYIKLIEGFSNIRLELEDKEFEYIEYRRHSACHIYQNSYQHIQENLRFKKERKGKKLHDIRLGLQELILKHGSDRNLDTFINTKLQIKITELYNRLR